MRYLKEKPQGNFKPLHIEGYYISEDGVIMHEVTTGNHKGSYSIVKSFMQKRGHRQIAYIQNITCLTVDRAVYKAFVGDLKSNEYILHKDGDPTNNHYTNLEKVNYTEYVKHYPFKNHKKVIDENGNVYPSVMDASRHLYVAHTTIRNYCKDGYKGRLELNVKEVKDNE